MPLDALASIATMTKVATTKAAGICGDDLAVNTKILMGLKPERETPAVLKVMRGSLLNKAVLIPIALGVSFFAPWAVLPMLAVGGLHLASEGARNLLGKGHGHGHGHGGHDDHDHDHAPHADDAKSLEKKKVKGALTVDFILSAEITVLTLSFVAGAALMTQLAVLAGTGIAMTAGMYGLIGGLVNMEGAGQWLSRREGKGAVGKTCRALGKAMSKAVPPIMKGISIAGTVALFIIGGELLLHGIPGAEHLVTSSLASLGAQGAVQSTLAFLAETAAGFAAGFAALPLMDKIEPLVEKAAGLVKKHVAEAGKKIKTFRAKDKTRQPAPAAKPAAAPKAAPATPAPLASVPDVKAAVNTAAAKPANNAALPPKANPTSPPNKITPPA